MTHSLRQKSGSKSNYRHNRIDFGIGVSILCIKFVKIKLRMNQEVL